MYFTKIKKQFYFELKKGSERNGKFAALGLITIHFLYGIEGHNEQCRFTLSELIDYARLIPKRGNGKTNEQFIEVLKELVKKEWITIELDEGKDLDSIKITDRMIARFVKRENNKGETYYNAFSGKDEPFVMLEEEEVKKLQDYYDSQETLKGGIANILYMYVLIKEGMCMMPDVVKISYVPLGTQKARTEFDKKTISAYINILVKAKMIAIIQYTLYKKEGKFMIGNPKTVNVYTFEEYIDRLSEIDAEITNYYKGKVITNRKIVTTIE